MTKTNNKNLAATIWGRTRIKHDEFALILLGVGLTHPKCTFFFSGSQVVNKFDLHPGVARGRKCAPACCEWKTVSSRSACEFAKWRCSQCSHAPNIQTYCPLQKKVWLVNDAQNYRPGSKCIRGEHI